MIINDDKTDRTWNEIHEIVQVHSSILKKCIFLGSVVFDDDVSVRDMPGKYIIHGSLYKEN